MTHLAEKRASSFPRGLTNCQSRASSRAATRCRSFCARRKSASKKPLSRANEKARREAGLSHSIEARSGLYRSPAINISRAPEPERPS